MLVSCYGPLSMRPFMWVFSFSNRGLAGSVAPTDDPHRTSGSGRTGRIPAGGERLHDLPVRVSHDSRFLTVEGLPLEILQGAWQEWVPGMEFALNFLRTQCWYRQPDAPIVALTFGNVSREKLEMKKSRLRTSRSSGRRAPGAGAR
jgi:hypothetical protein